MICLSTLSDTEFFVLVIILLLLNAWVIDKFDGDDETLNFKDWE